jgi:hypothetical protein
MGGTNGSINISFLIFYFMFLFKIGGKFTFSIKCITTKSSTRDQPFLYLFIGHFTNLVLLIDL